MAERNKNKENRKTQSKALDNYMLRVYYDPK